MNLPFFFLLQHKPNNSADSLPFWSSHTCFPFTALPGNSSNTVNSQSECLPCSVSYQYFCGPASPWLSVLSYFILCRVHTLLATKKMIFLVSVFPRGKKPITLIFFFHKHWEPHGSHHRAVSHFSTQTGEALSHNYTKASGSSMNHTVLV